MNTESRLKTPVARVYPIFSNPEKDWLSDLFAKHRHLVFRYTASRCGEQAAVDLVSETFLEAGIHRESFDPDRGSEAAWLLGIATNRIHRLRRRTARQAVSPVSESRQFGGYDPELLDLPDRVDGQREAHRVWTAVKELPEGERSAFLLHALEGLTVKEVGMALSISNTAAKVRIFRARRRLRANLLNPNDSKGTS